MIIHECQFIINFLTNSPKPLSSETVKTLREYQCGFEGSTAKVCCPSEPVTIDDANSRITPPDVTTHKNYNLLPLKTCGPLNSDDRIIGGNKTSLFQFPWMALISYQTGIENICLKPDPKMSKQFQFLISLLMNFGFLVSYFSTSSSASSFSFILYVLLSILR